jgi:hypothetical protein
MKNPAPDKSPLARNAARLRVRKKTKMGAIYRLHGGKKVSKLWAHAQKMVFHSVVAKT